jgi:ParB family transcriptional regulator, chromosome partitioning protein
MNSFQALTSSSSVDWFTPSSIIEKAREVMGSIELDPASCAEAQTIVKANRYFTEVDNGLTKHWIAETLWLNPPYGTLGSKFCEKLLSEWSKGNFEQALVLVRGDSKAMEALFHHAYHCRSKRICFTPSAALLKQKRREAGLKGQVWKNAPVPGSTLFYFGDHPITFTKVFSDQGKVFPMCLN